VNMFMKMYCEMNHVNTEKSDRPDNLITMLTTFQAMNRQNAHPGLPQSVSRSELGLVHRG